jgi:hypothetical protein
MIIMKELFWGVVPPFWSIRVKIINVDLVSAIKLESVQLSGCSGNMPFSGNQGRSLQNFIMTVIKAILGIRELGKTSIQGLGRNGFEGFLQEAQWEEKN